MLAVYVAPALFADDTGGAPTLADFPDWLDWPATLATNFTVEFRIGGSSSVVEGPLMAADERSSELWRQLFPPETRVTPFEATDDLTTRPVMTFSASTVMDSLRRSYTQTALDAVDDLPLIAPPAAGLGAEDRPFADVFQAIADPANAFLLSGDDQEFTNGFTTLLANARRAGREGMTELLPAGTPAAEIARAVAFHRGPQTAPPPRDPDADADRQRAVRESLDFHRTLTAVSEHPALLRKLGLVVDIEIPAGSLEPRSGVVQVLGDWTPQLGPDATVNRGLWVAWRLDPQATRPFAAGSAGPPGILNVGPSSSYRIEQVAVDSATLQTVSMAANLPPEGQRSAPPALATGGLMLLHDGRAAAVHADLAAAVSLRGSTPEEPLRAEDLIRGYRFDVFDTERAAWFSLHERTVRYLRDGRELIEPVREEGAHHPSLTSPYREPGTEHGPDDPIFLHEGFVKWDGWSLSAPRPGRSLAAQLSESDLASPADMTERVTNDPLTTAGISVETAVAAGTLPRLRFGATYRMRARTVDLAGNGLTRAEADELWTRPTLAGGDGTAPRPEDLDTEPITFRRFEPVPPPTVTNSNPKDESAYQLVVRTGLDDDVSSLVDTTTADKIQLYAPSGSVQLAEWHGRFDDAIGSSETSRHRTSYDVAARDGRPLPPTGSENVPYLPDPLGVGFALADTPGTPPGITFLRAWDAQPWHDPRPVTLQLLANDEAFQPAPDYDPATRTLTIKLDPARRFPIRLGSMLPRNPPMALLDWVQQSAVFDEQQVARIVNVAVPQSRHCMFTPWQDLELVHAVQRPLKAPDLRAESAVIRHPGDSRFQTTASFIPEPFSTGTVFLSASWTDFVDDPTQPLAVPAAGQPPPWTRRVDTVVGNVALAEPKLQNGVPPVFDRTDLYFEGSTMPELEFGDTKHRVVTFTATAVSRFAEYFPATLAAEPGRLSRTGESVDYIALNTGRPPPPVVLDIAPLLKRSTDPQDLSVRVREGGWVRIRLARPWFVTGEGERLGIVVLDPQPSAPPRHAVQNSVASLLGQDGAFRSDQITMAPERVLNAAGTEQTQLKETAGSLPDLNATVLTFDPEFDQDRQCWYVDAHLDIGETYMPLARLALVRYQRRSVPGEGEAVGYYAASDVVATEPIPLLPTRRLRVRPDPNEILPLEQRSLRISLAGPTYRHDPGTDTDTMAGAPATVTARAQRRLHVPLTGGDDAWQTVATFGMGRSPDGGKWTREIVMSDLVDVDRLLVVEEARVPQDPAVPQQSGTASRVVYAEAVDGPFVLFPPDDGGPDEPPRPVE